MKRNHNAVAQFGTNGGKTSLFDRSLHRFYIAHSKTPEDNAGLQSYAVQ